MPTHTEMLKMPALQIAWRIYYSLFALLVGSGLCIFFGFSTVIRSRQEWSLMFALKLVLLVLANGAVWACLGWLYANRAFHAFRALVIEGDGVIVYKGVWWRSEIMVPISRLQHIDVDQGPLDRRWSMARLTLHTAGTHDRGTRIYGLPVEQAHALRTVLLPRQPLVHD
jgi:membrane protein YdbS with pleckstrin-like domain